MVRALIRDLHRSPIGRKGLAEAIESFAEDMTKGLQTKIETDVVEVSLPPPIQLLIYQIAREATMNALKHAEADTISISLREKDDGVELQIRDDGKGFDTAAPPPEGHFGSVMMKERALVTGGSFRIESELGSGTVITATFPRVWVEEGTLFESQAATSGPPQTPPQQKTTVGRPQPSPGATISPSPAAVDQQPDQKEDVPPTEPPAPEEVQAPSTRREALAGLLRRRSA
jgi:anti-sigma regulatory factor (Ser/Thr protein kinase)